MVATRNFPLYEEKFAPSETDAAIELAKLAPAALGEVTFEETN